MARTPLVNSRISFPRLKTPIVIRFRNTKHLRLKFSSRLASTVRVRKANELTRSWQHFVPSQGPD